MHSSSPASVTQWEKKCNLCWGGPQREVPSRVLHFSWGAFFCRVTTLQYWTVVKKWEKRKRRKKSFLFWSTTHKITLCESEVVVQLLLRKSILSILGTFLGSGLRQQPLFCGCFYKYSITLSCCAIDIKKNKKKLWILRWA